MGLPASRTSCEIATAHRTLAPNRRPVSPVGRDDRRGVAKGVMADVPAHASAPPSAHRTEADFTGVNTRS